MYLLLVNVLILTTQYNVEAYHMRAEKTKYNHSLLLCFLFNNVLLYCTRIINTYASYNGRTFCYNT
jgi:hypothetical protein